MPDKENKTQFIHLELMSVVIHVTIMQLPEFEHPHKHQAVPIT